MDMGLSKPQEIVKDREVWPAAVEGVKKSQTWLRDWTAKHVHPKFLNDSFPTAFSSGNYA